MIPDPEALVVAHLLADPDVAALDARVATRTPAEDKMTRPWVRVTQLDAAAVPTSPTDHLVNFLVQLDCYADEANTSLQASLIARTVRASLKQMPDTDHDGAVVSSVRFTGMLRLPDQDFEPARERVVLTAQVWAHEV